MHTFRKHLAAAVMFAALAAPALASADTSASAGLSADTQAKVQALLAQIKTLQDQIKNLVGSSTTNMHWNVVTGSSTIAWNPGQVGKAVCVSINRTLRQGDQGDDVKNIQQMLANDPDSGFKGSVTGFFGPLTAKAMARFQMMNGIASSTDGTVGSLTRGFFERRCGNGLDGKQGKMQGGMINMAWVAGSISANNTSSITINTGNGTVIANINASTTIKIFAGTSTPPTTGSVSDLIVGKKARASGQKNSDGSISAIMIDVGDTLPPMPMMKEMMDDKGGMRPQGMMPTLNGPQHGPGMSGGPQNW